MASFTPQILKIWRERAASPISLRMYVVTVALPPLDPYGVRSQSGPVIGANRRRLLPTSVIRGLKWRFRDG